MTIDPESLRELAAERGFWPATTERLTSSGTVGRLRFTLRIVTAENQASAAIPQLALGISKATPQ
jgi:hypothetical protein